jgi:RND family efflux transporter MFP subunit
MKTWTKYLLGTVIIALAGVVFYKKVFIPKHTFATLKPVQGDLQESVEGMGNVDALHTYTITAQTGGKILKLLTDNGLWVKKGDLLVEIDAVELPAQIDAAHASLTKANYETKASQSELENQKAQKTLVQITYDRYKRLHEKGFASQAEYDKASADLHSIDASMSATSSRIDAAKSAATIAIKNLDALKIKSNRLSVYAPTDGYIISRGAEVAQSVSSSTPIFTLVDPATLWVKTTIDERISTHIRPSQNAIITLRSQPDKPYQGVVQRISATSDPITLEREVDVAFTTIPKPFYINEQAKVSILVKNHADVLTIPSTAVVQKDKHTGIWILQDGHAHFVEANTTAQNNTQIALSNVDKNTQIIIPNAAKKPLSEGMKIYP